MKFIFTKLIPISFLLTMMIFAFVSCDKNEYESIPTEPVLDSAAPLETTQRDETTLNNIEGSTPQSSDVTPSESEEIATSVPEDTTTSVPEDTTTSVPEDTTTSVPEDTTTSVPEDTTTSVPEDTTTSVPEDTTTSVPEDTTTSVPEDTTTSVPEDTTTSVPEDTTTSVPEDTTTSVPEAPAPSVPELNSAPKLSESQIKNHTAMPLWPENNTPYDISGATVKATIAAYLAEGSKSAVIIFPGGGYFQLSVANEGTKIAQEYNKAGISAFVVTYRYKSRNDPVSAYDGRATLADGQRAVQFVRYYSEAFGIDKDKIAVCGFSAGGHLAMLTCQHTPTENLVNDVIGAEASLPNACILAYAVTTLGNGTYHTMPPNFLGDKATDAAEIAKYSYGHNIAAMPDTFIFYSKRDTAVNPSKNSDALAEAMRAANKSVTLKAYSDGSHGIGLGKQHPEFSKWHSDSVLFLKNIGF